MKLARPEPNSRSLNDTQERTVDGVGEAGNLKILIGDAIKR